MTFKPKRVRVWTMRQTKQGTTVVFRAEDAGEDVRPIIESYRSGEIEAKPGDVGTITYTPGRHHGHWVFLRDGCLSI